MLTARPTPFGRFFWEQFSHWSIRLRFAEVVLPSVPQLDPRKSLLLIGNHISWWDGFWPLEINRLHFGKNYHVMMLEEQLAQRPFMRQGGAFSIQPGNRSLLDSIRYAVELLQDPENMVLIYPQGKIHSQHEHQVQFEPGIEYILRRLDSRCQILLFATFTDFMEKPKPTLFWHTGKFEMKKGDGLAELQAGYQAFFAQSLTRQKELACR